MEGGERGDADADVVVVVVVVVVGDDGTTAVCPPRCAGDTVHDKVLDRDRTGVGGASHRRKVGIRSMAQFLHKLGS